MPVANRELMRAINRFAILHTIRDSVSISRMDIAKEAGLSRATVTGITAELLESGMVLEGNSDASKSGRRQVPLSLNPEGAFTVGVHLSINLVTVVLMDLQVSILKTYSQPLDKNDVSVETMVDILVHFIQQCLWDASFSKQQISGIGIAIPGLIDSRQGIVHYIPNFSWNNVPCRAHQGAG